MTILIGWNICLKQWQVALDKYVPISILWTIKLIIIPPWTKFRGVYRNHSVCLSICLSVHLSAQICVRPITFWGFDISLPYLAHGCITMRHLWSRYDLELWSQGKIYCFLKKKKLFKPNLVSASPSVKQISIERCWPQYNS